MTVDRGVMGFAGVFILISVALAQIHSVHWLWFTLFVGANMLQAAFTRWCLLAKILGRVGFRQGAVFR